MRGNQCPISMEEMDSHSGDYRRHVASLNKAGNIYFCSDEFDHAQEMFDTAIKLMRSTGKSSRSLTGSMTKCFQKLHNSLSPPVVDHEYPPDSYFEGECDVGPRPIRSPLHFDADVFDTCDSFCIEAVLYFNKAVTLHSRSALGQAFDAYNLALAVVESNSTPSQPSDSSGGAGAGAGATSNLFYLKMLIHNNLGQIRYLDGEEDASLYHFRTALEWSKQIQQVLYNGDFTLHFATVTSNLARTLWMQGQVSQTVLQMFQAVLQLRTSVLPNNHYDVATAQLNLGFIYYARNEKSVSLGFLRQYLQTASESAKGALDPIPAVCYIILIQHEDDCSEDSLVIEMVRAIRALLDKREDLGVTNVEVASLLNYIGTLLFHRRDLENAILFYEKELEIEQKLGRRTPGISVSVTYNNIGRIHQELCRFPEAIMYYKRALELEADQSSNCLVVPSNEFMSESSMNLFSTIWYNLGLIHDRMGSRTEAVKAFKVSLNLRQTLLGNDHPDVACLWYNIGTLQMESHKLADATASFREALRIRRLGAFHEESRKVLATLGKLASLLESRGQIDAALSTLQEISSIHRSSDDYFELASTLVKVCEMRHALGQPKMARDVAMESLDCLFRSQELTNSNHSKHIRALEAAASTMILIGSLEHELCLLEKASETLLKASHWMDAAASHFGCLPSFISLQESVEMLRNQSCAPMA